MKPPPLLLGATLAFWGWQSEFLVVGLVMGVILEGARLTKLRWEFSDEDFSRIWTFCSVLFLGTAVYAFTANEGPASFGNFFQNPNIRTQGGAGLSTARAGAAMLRWLPMIYFPFLAAQIFSTREKIPLSMISFFARRRRRKAQQAGQPAPPARDVDVGYPYFAGTLLAASIHSSENNTFFWGLCALLTWALWAQRSRRFAFAVWLGTLAVAIALGFFGQQGLSHLQRYLERLNPSWFTRFMRRDTDPALSKTALGRIGNLKLSGHIVIRLEPHEGQRAPDYLREASYRLYRSPGATWSAGSSREDYLVVPEDPANSGNWNLLADKTNSAAVHIACYLEGAKSNSPAGLLPLPSGSGRLEKLAAFVLEKNTAGAVLAQGPGLVMFDALYGPGATIDSPPGYGSTNRAHRGPRAMIEAQPPPGDRPGFNATYDSFPWKAGTNEDLAVPEGELAALDKVIDEIQLRGERDPEKIKRAVGGFFGSSKFTYRTWQLPPSLKSTNETHLSRFLLETRAGHCEYFATATALLLRRLEIPTRYAVGYAIHETSGSGYVIRLRDAHAWCFVWDAKEKIWRDFDTTPASWVEMEEKNKSPFQWLSDMFTRIGFELSKLKLRWTQGQLQPYVLWLIVPVLALLLYQILFRRGRKRRRAASQEHPEIFDWPGLDSEFYQLEKKLADRGVPRGASEPMSDWLHRVAETPSLAELHAPLEEILRLHYRYRFDPLGLNEADREVLRAEVRECLANLSRAERPAVAAGK